MGKLYQTPLLPVEEDQVTRKYSIGRPNSFLHAGRGITPLIRRKAAANASPDTSPTNRASASFPPIRSLSPTPTLSNLKLLLFSTS